MTRQFSADAARAIWSRYLSSRLMAGDWRIEAEKRRELDGRFLDFVGRVYHPGPGHRILETGCGTAVNLFELCRVHGAEGFGVDVVAEVHEIHRGFAGHFGRSIRFTVSDSRQLPFCSGSMDLVYSRGVLEHHPDPLPSLSEQVRLLKPDSVLIIGVPQPYNPYTLVKTLRILARRWPWGWETQYSVSALRRMASRFPLEFIAADGDGYCAGQDLGLGSLRRLAHGLARENRDGLTRRLARGLDRKFRILEEDFPSVLFQEALVAFRRTGGA